MKFYVIELQYNKTLKYYFTRFDEFTGKAKFGQLSAGGFKLFKSKKDALERLPAVIRGYEGKEVRITHLEVIEEIKDGHDNRLHHGKVGGDGHENQQSPETCGRTTL